MTRAWVFEKHWGSAAEFHARELPDPPARFIWLMEFDSPALVLGSAQPESSIDRDACARAGIEVVRRRSGGGAVLLEPGDVTWLDVVLPRDDPRWEDDLGSSFLWLGHLWREALVDAAASVGVSVEPVVHRGAFQRRQWSEAVCFAGLGAGEVTIAGRKLVGVSQRRTRSAARFQCALLGLWRPERLLPLLAPPRPSSEELARLGVGLVELGIDPAAVVDAFIALVT